MKFSGAQAAIPPAAHLSEQFFGGFTAGLLRGLSIFGVLSAKSYRKDCAKKSRAKFRKNILHDSMRKSAIVVLVLLVYAAARAQQKPSRQQPRKFAATI